jgi:molybdate transport system substrate-binding protein
MHLNSYLKIILSLALLVNSVASHAEQKITVYAAASLTNALSEIGAQYTAAQVVHSFAASSALAKQIENGAPTDIFISADTKWMNYLQDKNLVNRASRKDLLANNLVLIAPKGRGFKVHLDSSFDLVHAFSGKLCTADIDSVPSGIYAKQALSYLGWWPKIKSRVVGAQDVRAALVFVERGECAAGIVYATDAKLSSKVEILATFPEVSHLPIVYPAVLIINGGSSNISNLSRDYLNYLQSPMAIAIFKKYGFSIPIRHKSND